VKLFARWKNRAAAVGATVFSMLLLAAPVLAQEENAPGPEDSPTGWIFRWLNFAIVAGAIIYVFAKVGGPAFRKRADEIQNAIAEGTRAREEAARRRKEADEKLANLENEIAGMREQAKRDAGAEAERIRGLTRDEAAKIDRAAAMEVAAAERAARLELKALAARMAVERAETMLLQQLTPAEDARIVREFVAGLAGSAN
jgi:F-type H+-transporting ATPase subunit b